MTHSKVCSQCNFVILLEDWKEQKSSKTRSLVAFRVRFHILPSGQQTWHPALSAASISFQDFMQSCDPEG
ncbi:MAG: hypothetical protein ABIH23_33265 [bacterium]